MKKRLKDLSSSQGTVCVDIELSQSKEKEMDTLQSCFQMCKDRLSTHQTMFSRGTESRWTAKVEPFLHCAEHAEHRFFITPSLDGFAVLFNITACVDVTSKMVKSNSVRTASVVERSDLQASLRAVPHARTAVFFQLGFVKNPNFLHMQRLGPSGKRQCTRFARVSPISPRLQFITV